MQPRPVTQRKPTGHPPAATAATAGAPDTSTPRQPSPCSSTRSGRDSASAAGMPYSHSASCRAAGRGHEGLGQGWCRGWRMNVHVLPSRSPGPGTTGSAPARRAAKPRYRPAAQASTHLVCDLEDVRLLDVLQYRCLGRGLVIPKHRAPVDVDDDGAVGALARRCHRCTHRVCRGPARQPQRACHKRICSLQFARMRAEVAGRWRRAGWCPSAPLTSASAAAPAHVRTPDARCEGAGGASVEGRSVPQPTHTPTLILSTGSAAGSRKQSPYSCVLACRGGGGGTARSRR